MLARIHSSDDDAGCAAHSIEPAVAAERQRIAENYWMYNPAGIPIPGCMAAFRIPRSPRVRQITSGKQATLVPFAVEYEHRRQPITTQDEFVAAISRIADPAYDFGGPEAIQDAFRAAIDVASIKDQQARKRRAERFGGEERLQHELAAKNLPDGYAQNISLIRQAMQRAR